MPFPHHFCCCCRYLCPLLSDLVHLFWESLPFPTLPAGRTQPRACTQVLGDSSLSTSSLPLLLCLPWDHNNPTLQIIDCLIVFNNGLRHKFLHCLVQSNWGRDTFGSQSEVCPNPRLFLTSSKRGGLLACCSLCAVSPPPFTR